MEAPDIECPEHGPMSRIYHKDRIEVIVCKVCGLKPIDLLRDVRIEKWAAS